MLNITKLCKIREVIADKTYQFCYDTAGNADLNVSNSFGDITGWTNAIYPFEKFDSRLYMNAVIVLGLDFCTTVFLISPTDDESLAYDTEHSYYLLSYPRINQINVCLKSSLESQREETLSRLDWVISHHKKVYPNLNKPNIRLFLQHLEANKDTFNYSTAMHPERGCLIRNKEMLWGKTDPDKPNFSLTKLLGIENIGWLTVPGSHPDIYSTFIPTTDLMFSEIGKLPNRGFSEAVHRLKYLLSLPTKETIVDRERIISNE
jgi:hypothetical protein